MPTNYCQNACLIISSLTEQSVFKVSQYIHPAMHHPSLHPSICPSIHQDQAIQYIIITYNYKWSSGSIRLCLVFSSDVCTINKINENIHIYNVCFLILSSMCSRYYKYYNCKNHLTKKPTTLHCSVVVVVLVVDDASRLHDFIAL